MANFAHQAIKLAPTGSVGNARFYADGLEGAQSIAVEFVVEAIGATPTVSYTIQGLKMGGDPTVNSDWVDIAYLDMDSTTASSKVAIVATTISRVVKFLDGLDRRWFSAIAILTTANTNVTFRANAYPSP